MRKLERRMFLSTGLCSAGSAMVAACQRRGAVAAPAGREPNQQEGSPRVSNMLPRRRFGRSGETVSALGLGGYHLGLPEEAEAIYIMHRAIEAGMTFFDNCWSYHGGESERRMGKALAGSKRGQVFLMTKIDGRTRAAAAAQIDACLKRLGTDYVDLMQIHEVVRHEDAAWTFSEDGAIRALDDARRAGKVRYVGFTGHKSPAIHLSMLEEAERHGYRFDAVQMPLSVADAHFESFQTGVLPELNRKGIAPIGMKALGAGDIPKSGVATAQECLRYALGLSAATVVTGCDTLEILEQALAVGRGFVPMSSEEEAELLARTREPSRLGEHERFKTTDTFDSTVHNPHWMTGAEL